MPQIRERIAKELQSACLLMNEHSGESRISDQNVQPSVIDLRFLTSNSDNNPESDTDSDSDSSISSFEVDLAPKYLPV